MTRSSVVSSVSLLSVVSLLLLTVAVFEERPRCAVGCDADVLAHRFSSVDCPSSHVTVTGFVTVLVQLAGSEPLIISPCGKVSLTCTPVAVPALMALGTVRA